MGTSRNTKPILVFLLGVVGVVMVVGRPANADFTFGPPARVGSGIDPLDQILCLSYDGLEMYINSTRSGGQGAADLWVLKRASKDEDWGPPQNLGPAVNSSAEEWLASISADGLTLYFSSLRLYYSGSSSGFDIFVATRATKNDPWSQAVKMGPEINRAGAGNYGAWILPDDLELYVNSEGRPDMYGRTDLYVARRATAKDPWSDAVNLGPVVNSPYGENLSSLSPDGLLVLFSPNFGSTGGVRPGGYGQCDIWMARRASLSDPWQAPVNLGPIVNSPQDDCLARISPDGHTLYLGSTRSGSIDNYQVPILPIMDFNGDWTADLDDLVLLIDNWGTDNTLYDIGPFAWGDGKVDIEDLKVFITEWEKETAAAQP